MHFLFFSVGLDCKSHWRKVIIFDKSLSENFFIKLRKIAYISFCWSLSFSQIDIRFIEICDVKDKMRYNFGKLHYFYYILTELYERFALSRKELFHVFGKLYYRVAVTLYYSRKLFSARSASRKHSGSFIQYSRTTRHD